MKFTVSSEQDMHNVVVAVLSLLKDVSQPSPAVVLALNGDLGAGKTTFVKNLAKELGVVEYVTSPTFVIQKSYDINYKNKDRQFNKLVHIDAYRLMSGVDTEVLDFKQTLLTPNALVAIEWAENIKDVLPKDVITLNFKYVDETIREVFL